MRIGTFNSNVLITNSITIPFESFQKMFRRTYKIVRYDLAIVGIVIVCTFICN